MTNLINAKDGWLREENPDLYSMLKALDGEAEALAWLQNKSPGLACLTRAIMGQKDALAALRQMDPQELEYVHGAIINCGQLSWLAERSPELALLFEAIKGDDGSLKKLKRKKAALAKLAVQVRELVNAVAPEIDVPVEDGQSSITEGETADVGILVGEHHLRQHDYVRAIEAFSRAIETSPTPDAYEGRARAYRALALEDERRAQELRQFEEKMTSTPEGKAKGDANPERERE